jgi:hypothetical protein
MNEHRSVVINHDRGRNCRMVITKTHRDGAVVTKRMRQCD